MDSIQLKLCDIQGRMFERSTAYASEGFIRDFMNSEVAEHLDSPYNKLQWMGEEYLIDELKDEKTLGTDGEKRAEQENLPPGTGKDHEAQLYGFSHV